MNLEELTTDLRKDPAYRRWGIIYAPWLWLERQWLRWKARRWRRMIDNPKQWHGPKEEMDDDLYIVSDDITLSYGVGETSEEAWADYRDGVLALLEAVEGAAKDNPQDARVAKRIREYVQKFVDIK